MVKLRQEFAFWPAGTLGVVVEMRKALLNGFDCAVHLDGREGPSCFYDRELELVGQVVGVPTSASGGES